VLSTLAYEVGTENVSADDVLAVVLRHTGAEGRSYVTARLSGPGVANSTGQLTLRGDMRARLEGGELHLELMTRSEPFGAASARIVLPVR
jgi:hypothetical protein